MEKISTHAEKTLAKFEKDILKVHRLLCKFIPDRDKAHQWLYLKNDKFLGRTPRDLIKQGRTGYVVKTIKNSEEYRRYCDFKEEKLRSLESTIAKTKAILHGVPVPENPLPTDGSGEIPKEPTEESK